MRMDMTISLLKNKQRKRKNIYAYTGCSCKEYIKLEDEILEQF